MQNVCLKFSSFTRFNRAVPRYTSYPTAPQFTSLEETVYRETLLRFEKQQKPLSLYVHIPFCRTMCLFCACSVVLNRAPEKQERYVSHLLRELALLPFETRPVVTQLHFGGGTPTSLSAEQLAHFMTALKTRFVLAPQAEVSIEIDPRTVSEDEGKKLSFLKELGFNRVSFGVQDLDPKVQEAVRRRQSQEVSEATYRKARSLGFSGINLDLIYGLPYQTVESFTKTAEAIAAWRPDRIALFSYAKVPWLKAHQNAIAESTLPSAEEKLKIYLTAREIFLRAGYVGIGMDHFALQDDPVALAYKEKRLTRNFQGYSLPLADDMLGLGMSAIGFIDSTYAQNEKTLNAYEAKVSENKLPIGLGYVLNEEDQKRRFVIQSLMCHFEVDKQEFERRFGISFDLSFSKELKFLEKELVEETATHLIPTPLGRIFIRIVASAFDAHLKTGGYSKAI